MSFRDSASFGRRQEYIAVAELLRRNFDVYMTLVDDQGIDCILRLSSRRYVDVQIKARSKTAKNWNFFAAMSFAPRKNLFFIFYTEKNDCYWIMPSSAVDRLAIKNKSGKNKGKKSITLPKLLDNEKGLRFKKYLNDEGFKLLRR